MTMQPVDADIIISGAGPSGLIVGCEAALGGARVVILEKRSGPTWSRAGTLAPRVMEIFQSRGIADKVLKRAHELHHDPHSREGIWAGLQSIRYEAIDSDFKSVLMFAQLETEKLLAEHFASLGGDLRSNSEVLGFTQDKSGVSVDYRDSDGALQRIRGRYLVGADGNKSVVREAAGIVRTGTPARRIAVNVDAFIDNPYDQVLTVANNEHGWAMTYPLRDGVTRFAMIDARTMTDPPDRPLELEDAKAMLQRVHGTDYGITKVDAINRFHDALLVAETLRKDRVFLVGEAVRVHYPASGVGMNFCIQDAFNLGWKLAASALGRAPDWLLDTYESERMPEIRALIDDVERQCAIQFNFDSEHRALKRFIERDLLPLANVNKMICQNLAGLSAHYPAPEGSPGIVGRRLPNLKLTGTWAGRNLFETMHDQKFLLVDLIGLAALPIPCPDVRLVVVSADAEARAELGGLSSLLVRPDGHVAWASEQSLSNQRPDDAIRSWLNLGSEAPLFEIAHSEAA